MKINDFIANFSRSDFDVEKELEIKKYLPIEEKQLIAKGIIYECMEEIDGVIKMNSVQKYLSYVKYMILRHTNLEYTHDDYDTLRADGVLNVIMGYFKADADECNRVLELMVADRMRETSMDYTVAKFLHNLIGVFGGLSDKLSAKIDSVDFKSMIPDDFDVNKLTTFLNNNYKQ